MNILRRTLMAVGSMTLVALVIALAAPRAAHGVVATLVQVVNDTAHPVPTVATDSPAHQAIQFVEQPDTAGNTFVAESDILVPAGKRLVIEYISASLGTGFGDITLETTSGGTLAAYYLIEHSTDHTHKFFPTRIYADPGSTVRVFAQTDDINGSRVYGDVEISGYFVNIP